MVFKWTASNARLAQLDRASDSCSGRYRDLKAASSTLAVGQNFLFVWPTVRALHSKNRVASDCKWWVQRESARAVVVRPRDVLHI